MRDTERHEQKLQERYDQERHEQWMKEALNLARTAMTIGEVPIGAVIVKDGTIIGRGYNRRETDQNPLGHAELEAIREASRTLGGWRLSDCTLYVTLEPCPMCAGALVQARVKLLVYGANDPKAGYAGSLANVVRDDRLNHQLEVMSGVLREECAELLRTFFRRLREKER